MIKMLPPSIEKISYSIDNKNVNFDVLRLDTIHPVVSGNKWFKIMPNLIEAKKKGYTSVLSFGGAYSNHLHALSYACKTEGLKSIGMVRGQYPKKGSSTLDYCQKNGMEIIYLNRDQYKQKNQAHFLAHLKETYKAYIIPEGGANAIGVNACADINHFFAKKNYDVVALSAGTGAMAGGLLNQLPKNIKLWVFSSLKGGDFLTNDILQWIPEENKEAKKNQMQLELDYHFGGFAKYNPSLIAFLQSFYGQTAIKLDSIYNGKMAYGICQKLASHNSKIKLLMIHCGGLQGIDGVERKLGHRVY